MASQDRKKRGPDNSLSLERPSKKQIVGAPQEDYSKPKDASTLQHEHRAMLVRIQEKNVELHSIVTALKRLEAKQTRYDDTLEYTSRIWNQFIDSVKLLLGRLDIRINVEDVLPNKAKSQSTLLQLLTQSNLSEDMEAKDIEEALQKRAEQSHQLLSRLIEAVESERETIKSLIEVVKNGTPDAKVAAIAEVNAKLQAENTRQKQLLDELHVRVRTLSDSFDQKNAENIRMEEEVKNLREEMLNCKDERAATNKKYFKLETKHEADVADLKRQLVDASLAATQPALTTDVKETKQEIKTENGAPAPVTEELTDANDLAAMRLAQIEKLQAENLSLVKEVANLRRENAIVSDEKVSKSRPYLLLQHNYNNVVSDLEQARYQLEKASRELSAANSIYRQDREKMERDHEKRMEDMQIKLKEFETTMLRYRKERDGANQKLELQSKTAGSNSAQGNGEARLIFLMKDNDIKKLKEEVDKLKRELGRDPSDVGGVKALERQLAEDKEKLKNELHRFKGTSDEKKEISKHVERLERTIKELKQERDGLIGEIENIGKGFEDLQEQNVRLINQLSDRDHTLSKFLADQIKTAQMEVTLKEQHATSQEILNKANVTATRQDELVKRVETKCRQFQEIHKKQSDELKALQTLMEGLKRSEREKSQSTQQLKAQVEKLEKDLQESGQQVDERLQAADKEVKRAARLDEEIMLLRKKLERASRNGGGSGDTLVETQVKVLKSKLTCSVCSDREKSVIIARCYHMFCAECIQRNLEIRHRKCPGCAIPFSQNDVHSIYF
eukprot:TRINITY_DN3135_c0_g1_i1.p1 TRINITY_DN3135_c0_g1~~TRINITY_DN3135_c0_g1_i1.p1  ORF type:complete len:788 (+),score=286.55 TRINITY_DN3135_c0_g1_i1:202-2565(+)